MEREFVRVNVAVLAVSDGHTASDESTVKLIVDRLTDAGHQIVARERVKDSAQLIRAHFLRWIAEPEVDVVFVTGGIEAEATSAALEPLITRRLEGFSDLFRLLSYEEIGTSAMLIDALAAQCGSVFVFVLPGSIGAVRTALDRILIPQLDHRTTPKNLVMRMPRVASDPKHARPAQPIAAAAFGPARLAPSTAIRPPPWITPRALPQADRSSPPAQAVTADAAGVPVELPSAPTQRLPLPLVAPAKPPTTGSPKKETTAVGPPPPPPVPRRSASNIPVTVPVQTPPLAAQPMTVTPAMGVGVPMTSKPRAAASAPPELVNPRSPALAAVDPPATEPADATSPEAAEPIVAASPEVEHVRQPAPEPPPGHGTPATRSAVAATPVELAGSARVIDSSIASSITGTISAPDELPTFRGDMFPEGRRRRRTGKQIALVLTAFALAAVCLAGVITFVRDRNREAAASSADHRERGARKPAALPAPPAPAPPEMPSPEPAPIPEIEVDVPVPAPPATAVATRPPPATPPPHRPLIVTPPPPAPPPAPVVAPIEAPTRAEDGCDEVSCVLDRYKLPCCQKYKPADPGARLVNGLPETLDRAMVTSGIGKLKPIVIKCGELAGIKGTVKLAIEVAADGHVSDVTVAATPSEPLGACVAAAILKTTFARTQNGASFTYPFAF